MTNAPRQLIAGNWKMNGSREMAMGLAEELAALMSGLGEANCDVLICPPFPYLDCAGTSLSGSDIALGAQDCHAAVSGAHTGDVAPEMLKEIGCEYVILGHSERRTDHRETSAEVKAKAEAAYRAGLTAIVCVGETEAERKGGQALEVVGQQIADSVPADATASNTVIAYEPVWAIGTGLVPTTDDVAEMHKMIRDALVARFGDDGSQFRLQYGGSVKPGNAAELLAVPNVDGALVGGASLKGEDFFGIIKGAQAR